jgi:hypothetical protein
MRARPEDISSVAALPPLTPNGESSWAVAALGLAQLISRGPGCGCAVPENPNVNNNESSQSVQPPKRVLSGQAAAPIGTPPQVSGNQELRRSN